MAGFVDYNDGYVDPQISYQRGLESARATINAPIETAQKQATLERTTADNETSKFALATSKLSALQDAAMNLTPDNYNVQKNLLESHGIVKPGMMPDTFDPAWKASTINKLSADKQQLDIMAKRADVNYKNAETNKANAETKQLGVFDGANAPAINPSAGKNESLVANLPPAIGTQVKALAEGRMQFPSGMALKSPYWQQMLQAVSQYDPSFDAVNYNARSQTRKDFTSGKSAENLKALNTAIAHLGNLSDNFEKLDNSDYPTYNAVANKLGNAFGNTDIQTATSKVGADASATAHELAKVFRQTGMSEGEIKDWEDKINTSNSPAQTKAVIEEAVQLMNGRLESIGDQYNKGMGVSTDPLELLNPKAKIVYNKLSGAPGKIGVGGNAKQAGKLNTQDPRVAAALQHGYTPDEIAAYLGGQK